MNRVLILGENEKRAIAKVLAFARENRISMEQLKKGHEQFIAGTTPRAIGEDERHRCALPIGYLVVYSEEFHPGGLMRHLSVSVDTPGSGPSIPAIEMIMASFSFQRPSIQGNTELLVFLEEFPQPGTLPRVAVNIMERIFPSAVPDEVRH